MPVSNYALMVTKKTDRDKAKGDNFHFLLFYSPQPSRCPFAGL